MSSRVWVLNPANRVKELLDENQAYELADAFPDLIHFYADLVPPGTKIYPYDEGDFVVIGPEAFTDGNVISMQGENYYKACDIWVTQMIGGGDSFCVKRVDHPGDIHEDYEGVTRRA